MGSHIQQGYQLIPIYIQICESSSIYSSMLKSRAKIESLTKQGESLTKQGESLTKQGESLTKQGESLTTR